MRWLRVSWIVLSAVPLAGCASEDPGADRSPPIRYAPASDRDTADQDATAHGLPAGHLPLGGHSAGAADANVVRTGPAVLRLPGPGLTFSVPAGWKELRPSQMDAGVIDARLAVPVEGTAVEPQITMSHSGGGVELNIDRWKGQFPDVGDNVVEETVPVSGRDATWMHLRGEFRDPFRPARPEHADWAVIGVAIPLDGQRDFYVKLSGPREAVQSIRNDFRRFITGARLD